VHFIFKWSLSWLCMLSRDPRELWSETTLRFGPLSLPSQPSATDSTLLHAISTPAPVFLLRTTHKKHNLRSLLTFLRMEQSLFQVCKTNLLRREQSQVLVYSNINFLGARKAWRMACSLKVLFPPIEQLGFRWNASESNEMRN